MNKFKVKSKYSPSGDQPKAIEDVTKSINNNEQFSTLVGVTGSGKTYTMAKIIENTQKPTLIMTHNKTLAAQLYSEFKAFFPNNRVEYFISYYDYYQPESYIPRRDLFIEKTTDINSELERLRLSTTTSILEHDDVIVVASVSANYGLGSPTEYADMMIPIAVDEEYNQKKFLLSLISVGFKRNDDFFDRGCFRVNGDIIDIFPAYSENEYVRLEFFGDTCESITLYDYLNNSKIKSYDNYKLYPCTNFTVTDDTLKYAIKKIEEELEERLIYYKNENRMVEYTRLKNRIEFDLEMLNVTGTCKGVENYSRHLSRRNEGETPYTLLDYFQAKGEYLLFIDESHVSLPQFRGMYAGDRSRKEVLVEYGFRLPSALDNRPLRFDEFIKKSPHYIFVSATPNEEELSMSTTVTELIIRPTGIIEPKIDIVPTKNQIEHLHDEIKNTVIKEQRVLVNTLTKKMAESLTTYLSELGVKAIYMHSDIDVIERNQIIRKLRLKVVDVLIGINLLREGLDIPEVGLVAILDADKEGFLRSKTSLLQTIGRASRNAEGRVLLYADKMTDSIKDTLKTIEYRKKKQLAYNKEHNITPKNTVRSLDTNLKLEDYDNLKLNEKMKKLPKNEKNKLITELKKQMQKASKELNFEEAIRLRDEIEKIKRM